MPEHERSDTIDIGDDQRGIYHHQRVKSPMGVFIVRRRVLSIFRRRHLNSIRFAETACIIGISQGAWTVLKFAVSHPERVRALVLLSPGGIVPDKLSFVVLVLPLLLSGRWDIKRINRMVLGEQSVPAEP